MASTGSFFPHIESVFYAVFDVEQGPKIVHQVPEDLISTSTTTVSASTTLSPVSPGQPSGTNSASLRSLNATQTPSPRKRAASSNRSLFHFDDISKYVMPSSALCGRLVMCATRNHRIIGFPMNLWGAYPRNEFRYNLCFVFERSADLSCYEPIVRKASRVLTACEKESKYLSSPENSPAIHAILEQLYEDLNSYSETSIPMDRFNSIELKIFPFYPNPPPVKDYMVPLALINLTKRIEPNWDLTMVKVCQHIDGTNHVSRIARLADCDLDLTRQAIAHLLYYQVIMMIDIFQYSNMYTLRTSIQWLADESHVRDECGPYATKPGMAIADWPKLLHLYSRLKPGKTVREWMEEYDVASYGIDVRRFTSFGVIKGFLRRVHRWPVLLPEVDTATLQDERFGNPSSFGRKRGKSIATSAQPSQSSLRVEPDTMRGRLRSHGSLTPRPIMTTDFSIPSTTGGAQNGTAMPAFAPPGRRTSAAETSLEQLRSRPVRRSIQDVFNPRPPEQPSVPPPSPTPTPRTLTKTSSDPAARPPPPTGLTRSRPQLERSPSAPAMQQVYGPTQVPLGPTLPRELLDMLDGEHHTDEICTHLKVGWPIVRQWLVIAGGGRGDGDFGRVAIIYR